MGLVHGHPGCCDVSGLRMAGGESVMIKILFIAGSVLFTASSISKAILGDMEAMKSSLTLAIVALIAAKVLQ